MFLPLKLLELLQNFFSLNEQWYIVVRDRYLLTSTKKGGGGGHKKLTICENI